MTSEIHSKLLVKLPFDLRLWLEDEAKKNTSSLQAEIVRTLRDRQDRARRRDKVLEKVVG